LFNFVIRNHIESRMETAEESKLKTISFSGIFLFCFYRL